MNKIYTRCYNHIGEGVRYAVALKKCSILISLRCKRSYPSLLDAVSCATSHEAHFTRIVIIHLLHHRLKTDKTPGGAFVLFCRADVPTFQIVVAKPADLPKHSLAKVEEATLHSGVGKVALNSRDQVCFEIPNKFCQIKLGAKFFRFGKEHFKYPAIHGQIFPNSQTIYDGQ
ncbi:hypothetical protein T07_5938 [Trichinella nelsoni]|uniref:Uncharacterized protein n=1 Tax=Trichinella nelsoni TaxID=6336 RepID=A0A0V0SF97_9BILA|nr:hypothetical protein T07_5938 [Trichinella nelsoni]